MLQKEILDEIRALRKYEEEANAMIMSAILGMETDWEAKRDAQVENETDDMLYEKQSDLEDAAKDAFLDR